MVFGIDDALMIASVGASVLGGSKNKGGAPAASGFAAYPKEVQEYLLQTVLPQIQAQGQQPYRSLPMMRAPTNPTDPFASQGMAQLQKYSDAVGGLFKPMGVNYAPSGQGAAPTASPSPTSGQSPSQLAAQYLQGSQGGAHAANTQLQPMMTQGRTNLGDIGGALLGQGYNGTQAPSSVNFEALYRALGL